MPRGKRASRPSSPYMDFAGKSFKELAREPYPEYPDHFLSTTKRTRAADLIRSQKDLWDKDDKPHQWTLRVNKELRAKAGMLPPRKGNPPLGNGDFIRTYIPEQPQNVQAVYSQTRPPRNQSKLAWTDHGLVGADLPTAMRQFKDYGKRPGASQWATTYSGIGTGEGTMEEFKKRAPLPGLFYKGGRKGIMSTPVPRDMKPRAKKVAVEDDEEPRLKGYDKEIKRLAATLKDKVERHSRSAELVPPPVAFSWTGKGIGPNGMLRHMRHKEDATVPGPI